MLRSQRAGPLLLAALLWACDDSPSDLPDTLEPIRDFTVQETQVAVRSTAFGLRLLQEIAAAESKPNLLLSPLSASMALGMALNGANGQTYEAMRSVLDFDGLTNDEINAAYKGLIAQLRARDPKVEFQLANSVWHERSFPVEQSFLDATRASFDAKVAGLDFRSSGAVTTINDWVARSTGNRIKELIQQIDPLDVMFLINAVYFKAPWTKPFEPQGTRPRPFLTNTGATIDVPTMMQDAALRHFIGDGVQALELLYADSAYSMVVIAPEQKTTPLANVLQRLTRPQWDAWMARFQPGRVLVFMPKFRFDYMTQMKQPLTNLGMGIAFQPHVADFRRINSTRDDLYISSVLQKSFIDVHELGTEAAAATAVTISITSMPPVLEFDRPFLFAIRERSTGTLLFIGRIGDPTR